MARRRPHRRPPTTACRQPPNEPPINAIERKHLSVLGDTGPVLVYAHGFGCSQAMWSRVTPAFAGTHRQVLFDHVGSGQADRAAFDPRRCATLDGCAQDLLEVTASVGIVHFHDAREPAEALMHRADTAMYAAKAAGRGQVCQR